MLRWWSPLPWVLAVGSLGFLLFETKRLAELTGRAEVAAREADRERDTAKAALLAEAAQREAAAGEAARLAAELATAVAQLQGMTSVIEERTARFERVQAASAAANARALQPMSDGVRTCLATLHECLRAEGFGNHRFVQAARVDAEGLHEVEVVETEPDGLGAAFVRAGTMVAELDRGAGRLTLRFRDGHRFAAGERTPLPEDGWAVVFAPIDGRVFEQRLPYLIQATGTYPDDQPKSRRPDEVDPITRREWLERLDRLLARAGTAHELRVTRFRGLADGNFLQAELVGTDQHHRVMASAHVARLGVEVDGKTGVVSLLLRDGILRNGGAESTISGEGYRMLLPGLDPKQASDLMIGMVLVK